VGRLWRSALSCVALVCLGTILLSAGCGGGGSGGTQFRLMNAVPDVPNLDVLVNGTSVTTNLGYGTSTAYEAVKSGSQQVEIEQSGSANPLLTQAVTFASGADTTIIASNFSSSVNYLVLADDNSAPASGDFKLRLVNSSPTLGTADIYVVAPGTSIFTVSPTVGNVALNGVVNYESLAAGSYEIMVTVAGQKFVEIDSGTQTFSSGQVRTFVGLNNPAGGFSGFTFAILHDVN
jgi:hypothetical protein